MKRVVSCLFVLALAACAAAQDRSTPEACLDTFMAAFGHGDLARAAACVKGASPPSPQRAAFGSLLRTHPMPMKVAPLIAMRSGTTATVHGTFRLADTGAASGPGTQISVQFVQRGGNWLIVPDVPAVQAGRSDPINVYAYGLTDVHVLAKADRMSRSVVCLNNVRYICKGIYEYAQDHQGRLALTTASLRRALQRYVKRPYCFVCPAAPARSPAYAFNERLAGATMNGVANPARTVMVYEGANGRLDYRHSGKAAVGFVDGHTEMFTPSMAGQLRWKP